MSKKCRTQAACSFLTRPSWFSDYRNAVHVEKYGQLVGIHFSLPFPLVCTHFYFALLVRTFGIYIWEEQIFSAISFIILQYFHTVAFHQYCLNLHFHRAFLQSVNMVDINITFCCCKVLSTISYWSFWEINWTKCIIVKKWKVYVIIDDVGKASLIKLRTQISTVVWNDLLLTPLIACLLSPSDFVELLRNLAEFEVNAWFRKSCPFFECFLFLFCFVLSLRSILIFRMKVDKIISQ